MTPNSRALGRLKSKRAHGWWKDSKDGFKIWRPSPSVGKICTSTPATPHVASNLSCNWLLPHQHPTHQPAWTSSLSQALPKALPKPGALPKVSWPWSSPSSLSDSNRGEGGAPRRAIRDGDRRARMPNTPGNDTGPGDLLAKSPLYFQCLPVHVFLEACLLHLSPLPSQRLLDRLLP